MGNLTSELPFGSTEIAHILSRCPDLSVPELSILRYLHGRSSAVPLADLMGALRLSRGDAMHLVLRLQTRLRWHELELGSVALRAHDEDIAQIQVSFVPPASASLRLFRP